MNMIVCGYGEIHLKGSNRGFFVRQLTRNIRQVLPATVKVTVNDTRVLVSDYTDEKNTIAQLKKVFGLTTIKVCQQITYQTPADILTHLKSVKVTGTFKVEINRANKDFPVKSPAFAAQCGDIILQNNSTATVDLHQPATVITIEIRHQGVAYLATGFEHGLGGLPVGVSGKAICLISGGIDSPVAAFLAMKRGLAVDFVHFSTPPYTSNLALDKVVKLCRQVSEFGGTPNLYVVPFTEISTHIHQNCHEQYMITIMRRFMIALAEKIGIAHNCDCIITGENLAQVASQTIQGITTNNFVAKQLPILRPLICFDKNEIIALARQIGTYATSILPYQDCCTVFVPAHPVIKPNRQDVEREERKLNFDLLVDKCFSQVQQSDLTQTII